MRKCIQNVMHSRFGKTWKYLYLWYTILSYFWACVNMYTHFKQLNRLITKSLLLLCPKMHSTGLVFVFCTCFWVLGFQSLPTTFVQNIRTCIIKCCKCFKKVQAINLEIYILNCYNILQEPSLSKHTLHTVNRLKLDSLAAFNATLFGCNVLFIHAKKRGLC